MKFTHRIIVSTQAAALALPVAAFAAKGERKKDKTPAPTFASVDKDSNDAISESEFVAANEKLGADVAKTRFGQLDKDGDGKLSKEEFAADTGTDKKKRRKKKNQG